MIRVLDICRLDYRRDELSSKRGGLTYRNSRVVWASADFPVCLYGLSSFRIGGNCGEGGSSDQNI